MEFCSFAVSDFAICDGLSAKSNPAIQADRAEDTPEGFVVTEGFEIELIAREHLVADPVDMTIGEYGRFYIVECPATRWM